MFDADFAVGFWQENVQVDLAMLINAWTEHINTAEHAAEVLKAQAAGT
jgi:hypothetical protein